MASTGANAPATMFPKLPDGGQDWPISPAPNCHSSTGWAVNNRGGFQHPAGEPNISSRTFSEARLTAASPEFPRISGSVWDLQSLRVSRLVLWQRLGEAAITADRRGTVASCPRRWNRTAPRGTLVIGGALCRRPGGGGPGTKIGQADNPQVCVPVIDTQPHVELLYPVFVANAVVDREPTAETFFTVKSPIGKETGRDFGGQRVLFGREPF